MLNESIIGKERESCCFLTDRFVISCDFMSQCNYINLLVRWINDIDSVIKNLLLIYHLLDIYYLLL